MVNNKIFILSILNTAFKTITPWKKRVYTVEDSHSRIIEIAFTNGWNTCIKEIKKNRKKYLEFLEKKLK